MLQHISSPDFRNPLEEIARTGKELQSDLKKWNELQKKDGYPLSTIANYEIESIKNEEGKLIRYLVHVDFSITLRPKDIDFYETNKSWINKIRRKHAHTIAHEAFVKALMVIPTNSHGVNYNAKGKDPFTMIYYEGGRIV